MTVGAYAGVADRVVRDFPDDPVLVRQVLKANSLAPIITALAESFAAATEANVALRKSAAVSNTDRAAETVEWAVQRREAALIDIMQFFELNEVRAGELVVRRTGEGGLSIRCWTDVSRTAPA
jgi:hypothetical protein